jgi:hypothetical protein
MKFSAIILALTFAAAGAARPSAIVNLKAADLGSGLNADAIQGDVEISSELSDDVTVGLNYDKGDSSGIRSVFAKIKNRMGDGDVNADLSLDTSSNDITGDVTYENGENKLVAQVNSASDGLVESVELTRTSTSGGLSSRFSPKYVMADSSVSLEAEADLDKDTSLLVKLADGGNVADVEVNHKLDDKTDIKIEAQLQGGDAQLEVSRQLNEDDSIRPRIDLNSRHATCSWVRKLPRSRTATVNVDPDDSISFEIEADEDSSDWNIKMSAPLNNVGNPDITMSRKVNF